MDVNVMDAATLIMLAVGLAMDAFAVSITDGLCYENFHRKEALMTFEPSGEAVLGYVIRQYINAVLFGALMESAASEQGARMTAMDSATDNAQNIVDSLRLKYNRVRQSNITQELTEIINGSSAVD